MLPPLRCQRAQPALSDQSQHHAAKCTVVVAKEAAVAQAPPVVAEEACYTSPAENTDMAEELIAVEESKEPGLQTLLEPVVEY